MKKELRWVILICLGFAVCYSVLSVIRHLHFGSYGFDLGITDQIVWLYSILRAPITTVQAYPFTSILTDHVELMYVLIAPFYWLYRSPIMLLVLQAAALSFSGIPVYLLARKKKLRPVVCFALLVSFLMFYGMQNAVWFDVHSLSFGAAALAWFIYFLDAEQTHWIFITLVLAIISKEDVALLTGLVSAVYFLRRRDRNSLFAGIISLLYFAAIFGVYFPHFTHDGYRYATADGLGKHVSLSLFYDSADKRQTWLYSLGWFGFLPVASVLTLLPAIGDMAHYFVFAPNFTAAQGLFMHYRVTLGVLLALPTIDVISRWKKLNTVYIAIYLVVCALALQYVLHLPLSYLTKRWFWTMPASVTDIERGIRQLPKDASVVSQNNITPHLSERPLVFTLYPMTKDFTENSPCGVKTCDWLRWAGKPSYLIVDTSRDWDERSFLIPRERFITSVINLEKNGNIDLFFRSHETSVYRILHQPN